MSFEKVTADTERSEWNMALATLMRMDAILQRANESAAMGDFNNWFHSLMTLERECDPFLETEERGMADIQRRRVIPELARWRINTQRNDRLYLSLDNYDKLIRRLMKKHGLYAKESADPRMAAYG